MQAGFLKNKPANLILPKIIKLELSFLLVYSHFCFAINYKHD